MQGDLDIGDGYYTHYIPVFKQPEVRMMMSTAGSKAGQCDKLSGDSAHRERAAEKPPSFRWGPYT